MQDKESKDAEVTYHGCTIDGGKGSPRSIGMYDLESIGPNAMLAGGAVTILFDFAAMRMQDRDGRDVRVVDSIQFRNYVLDVPAEVFELAQLEAPRKTRGLAHNIRSWQIDTAEFILFVWGLGPHWSTLILCHPGL